MRILRRACLLVVLSMLIAETSALAADNVVVLMYHRFGEDKYPSTSIRVDQFKAQLEYIQSSGYTVVPLADVAAAVNDGSPLPERAVAITIDDAYRSVYDVAFPMFVAYEFPFTVFVSTDSVDEGLAAYMTWDQMREMATGGATYANHGAGHRSTLERGAGQSTGSWLEDVRGDVDKGARRLSEELDPMPGQFAYPYGEFNEDTGDLLREMGYISYGQHSGGIGPHSDSRALPRFPMAESFAGMDQFRTKIASIAMPVTSVEPWDPLTVNLMPTIVVGLAETDARLGELACFVSGQGRVEVDWQEPRRRFEVGPASAFRKGRQRVNCTAPGNDGRYLWFSHQWIIQ